MYTLPPRAPPTAASLLPFDLLRSSGRSAFRFGLASHERDVDHALAEVRRDLIRQIEDEKSRREHRKRRKTRYRTT